MAHMERLAERCVVTTLKIRQSMFDSRYVWEETEGNERSQHTFTVQKKQVKLTLAENSGRKFCQTN